MMHVAVSILTLSAVLVHALLGCCAHHAHAATDGVAALSHHATAQTHSPRPECCHGRHRHVPDRDNGDRDEHRPHRDCDEPSCNYVGSSKVELPSADRGVWTDLPPADSAVAAPLSRALWAHGEVPVERGRAPALRLHALYRVWLV